MLVASAATFVVVTTPFACTLDWDVRPDPGLSTDGAATDAIEAANDGTTTTDALNDAPPIDAADCAGLEADVVAKKPLARACQLGQSGQCTTTVKDECNCDVVVRFASDPNTDAYVAAIAAYRASCTPSCQACPQLSPPASWACLQSGSVIACVP